MADMRVDRVLGERTAPDHSANRARNKADTSFAGLLKNTSAAAGADSAERPLPQRVAAADESVPAAHAYGWLGTAAMSSAAPSASQTAAVVLEKLKGESDEDWQRRCITFETARRWQAVSRAWRAESAGMDLVDGMIYCDQKAARWVAELMENEPAMFREWLEQERWHMDESGIDNAILPDGFTEEDMGRWMARDVLEYL